MSTYVYLACLDHEPPLIACEESTQHRYTETEMADVQRWVEQRKMYAELVERDELDWSNYYLANSVRFLVQHVACQIAARDEHGEWIDLGEGLPAPVPVAAPDEEERGDE